MIPTLLPARRRARALALRLAPLVSLGRRAARPTGALALLAGLLVTGLSGQVDAAGLSVKADGPASSLAAGALTIPSIRPPDQVLQADEAFALTASRTADGTFSLSWRLAPGTYLYRDSLKATRDGTAVPLATSPAETKDDPNFGPVEVYHGTAEATAAGQPAIGALRVSFQGCAEDGICYPVVSRQVDLATLAVSAAPAALAFGPGPARTPAAPPLVLDGNAQAGDTHQAGDTQERTVRAESTQVVPARTGPAQGAPAGKGDAAVERAPVSTASARPVPATEAAGADPAETAAPLLTGNLAVMLAAFLGFGLVLAFTPCVFPMLPILSGILAGGGARPSPARGFALSAAYGLAMAAAYGALGLAAGWSGANLQAALQTPWALGAMAAVFAALALAMFGLFDLALPSALASRLSGGGRRGSLAGAAGLGFASALVVGPCVTPPLAAAMLYAAQTGDAARGGAALFMLGLGMGVPLVLIGTFGAQVLPRSGPWLSRIKQACGVLFLAVAAVLAARLMPPSAALALWGALLLGLGVFLGALERLHRASPWPAKLSKAAGLLAVIYGATLVVGAAGGAGDPLRPLAFLTSSPPVARIAQAESRVSTPAGLDAAVAQATAPGRPALVSFTADWCTVCKSNEKVMAEPEVVGRLARLPRIAADITSYGAGERALMQRFAVVGPPTLFLVDGEGRELPGTRHIGPLSVADLETLITQAGL